MLYPILDLTHQNSIAILSYFFDLNFH